ncbi:MAG: hypothetical protein Q4E55_04925 [Bacteroidales bacterium]|nr:hypothetical protein [Bacteroidales bacterium]
MKLIVEVPTYKEICKSAGNRNLSPSFRCSYSGVANGPSYFVEGNFEETDVAGRKLVYIFATSESDTLQAIEVLKRYAALLGVTPNEADLLEIEKHGFKPETLLNKFINTSSKKIVICVIIILLLLFMLLSLLNNPSTTNGVPKRTEFIETSR